MGKKVNPIAFRLGNFIDSSSKWFAPKTRNAYAQTLLEDTKIRKMLSTKLRPAGLAKIEIERSINKINVIVHVARPGMVIGRGGTGHEEMKKYLAEKVLGIKANVKTATKVDLKIEAVKEPNLSAQFVANNVADMLCKRMQAKRVLAQAIEKTMASGAKGIKIKLSGRIGGAEIARVQHEQAGVLPLSTMRSKIDYASSPALTRSGYVGVKVWICQS